MKPEFKHYRFKKFPISFVYPVYAKYRRFREKKYVRQITFREQKERFGRNERGKVVAIFPKLSVAVLRGYVPAYQTRDRQSYFMGFDFYLEKLVDLKSMKTAFPEMICDDIWIANTWKGVCATFKHPANSYWRSQIYLHEAEDDTKLVNILYRHKGTIRSEDELSTILDSFEIKPVD